MTTNLTEANETSINNGKNAKSFFCKLNKLVKKYKEFGITICAIVGTLATFYWNLLCEMYYNGYAKGLGIDTRFIEKDSQGLFISILIYLSSSLLLLPAIKKIDDQLDKNMNKPGKAFLSFLASVGLAIIPLGGFLLMIILTQGVFLTELLFLPFVILALLLNSAVVFFIQFICLFFEFIIKQLKKLKKSECDNSQQQNNDESNTTIAPPNISQPRNNWGKLLLAALLISIIFMPISYLFGWHQASQKEYFDFIVPKHDFLDAGADERLPLLRGQAVPACADAYNLILSQNSEYYCLSGYTISKVEGKEVIKILPDYQTIVPKSDDESVIIIRKHFVNVGKESCVTYT